jgi:chorismate synthase
MIRFLTAGESHGAALTVILEGLPAGMPVDFDAITHELAQRQRGYGRGARMKIEKDRAEVVGGIRNGMTTGGPICLQIHNKDWKNWKNKLSPYPEQNTERLQELVNPRPGHADLAGALKYGVDDFRDILERSSARETAARVAAASLAKQFLAHFKCEIRSHVIGVGSAHRPDAGKEIAWSEIIRIPDDSPLHCADKRLEKEMMEQIDQAAKRGDTLGGVVEIVAHTPPPGLGSFTQWDKRLDGMLARAMLSVPAIKAVGFGRGAESASLKGSELHDEIVYSSKKGLQRTSNNAGGIEGGITNGEELRIKIYMKPLSSLRRPLQSVDIKTMKAADAAKIRSDTCAVPAAGVVAEAMVALTLAEAAREKFGGDSLRQTLLNYENHKKRVEQLLKRKR